MSVVNNADSSPRREANPYTVDSQTTVCPWVLKDNPDVIGLCDIRRTPRSKGTPPGREGTGALPQAFGGAINPADVMYRASTSVKDKRGVSPTISNSSTTTTTTTTNIPK